MTRDTLENQILAFFDQNPDEELTAEDAQIKFGRTMNNTREIVQRMYERGLLSRRRQVEGKARTFVYSLAKEMEAA
jgi:predicted transcriptional regulator YheO